MFEYVQFIYQMHFLETIFCVGFFEQKFVLVTKIYCCVYVLREYEHIYVWPTWAKSKRGILHLSYANIEHHKDGFDPKMKVWGLNWPI
jgi:hypothetical protein